MTDSELLEKIIKESGLKKEKIAKHVGITAPWLRKKINNETEWKISEVRGICELLNIDAQGRENVFFKKQKGV